MKAARDRCLISLREADFGLLIDTLDSWHMRMGDAENEQHIAALRERLAHGRDAARKRGAAARIEQDLT